MSLVPAQTAIDNGRVMVSGLYGALRIQPKARRAVIPSSTALRSISDVTLPKFHTFVFTLELTAGLAPNTNGDFRQPNCQDP
jgi:hypothetical protein